MELEDVRKRNIESLARAVLSLEEPWRGRFISWIAERAGADVSSGLSLRKQMMDWFDDIALSHEVIILLSKWSGESL